MLKIKGKCFVVYLDDDFYGNVLMCIEPYDPTNWMDLPEFRVGSRAEAVKRET